MAQPIFFERRDILITQICRHIKNYFEYEFHPGSYTVSDGKISPCDFLIEGDFYRISGSRYNDGVHRHPASDLKDESFDGIVSLMALPDGFLKTVSEIESYCSSDDTSASPYLSESFGGYSYTRLTGSDGVGIPWQRAFKSRLNEWRKI